ncbi:MAG TPA: MMPL family transporter, partial [Candidatus Ozemobacteraceae bacterium]|nr:MMPL family transporter [Candidatus Ozemobacteraceae bacterium]
FGNDRILLVAFPVQAIDAALVRMLTQTERRLLALPNVQTVLSPVSPLRTQFGIASEAAIDKFLAEKKQLDRYLENLKKTTALEKLIISPAWNVGGMVIRLNQETGDLVGPTIQQIHRVLADCMPVGTKLTGVPEITRLILDMTRRDQKLFSPLTILLTAIVLFLLFRGWFGLLTPLLAICSAFIWTKGLLIAQGHAINFVTSILPPMILSIALTYCIHILTDYFEASRDLDGFDPRVLADSLRHVAYPIMLSTLTTVIGFGSLLYTSIESIGQFGAYAAIGTTVSMVLALTVLAAGIAARRKTGHVMPSTIKSLEASIDRLSRAMIRNPGRVWLVVFLLLVVSGYGLYKLPIETSLIRYLPDDHDIQEANRFVEENLSGIVPVELFLESDGRRFTEPDIVHRVRRFQEAVASVPYLDKSLSYVNLVQDFDRMFSGEPNHVPPTEEEVRDYLTFYAPAPASGALTPDELEEMAEASRTLLLELQAATDTDSRLEMASSADLLAKTATPATTTLFIAGGMLGELLSPDARTAHVSMRYRDRTSREMFAGFQMIEALAKKEFADSGIRATITGRAPLWAEVSEIIVWNEITSFGFSLLIITCIISGYFRSLKIGIVSMIPNTLPMIYTYGIMGLTGTTFNTVTGMIASIAIGLAVDDTIHIICQFQHELEKDGNEQEALVRTMVHKGRATVFASVILCTGFSVLALSSFGPTRYFGVFISVGVAAALICELLITPVALYTFKPIP